MHFNNKFSFTPIGYVKCNYMGQIPSEEAKKQISCIKILDKYKEGLDGLNEYSHIIVLYYFHKVKKEDVTLKVHPMKNPAYPLIGVFASRAQIRPNPIGLCVVKLLEVNDTTLKVKGLDAYDNSPVIDIKPYIPVIDCQPEAKYPDFIKPRK